MNLTLWGAYHRLVSPLEQRSLALHLDRAANVGVFIDAEDLVAHAPTRVEARWSGFVVRYRMKFSDDVGNPYTFELIQRLDDWTLRGWTELVGTVACGQTTDWGRACLRLDYRDVDFRQFWALAWSALLIV